MNKATPEEVLALYEELGSNKKTADHFGISSRHCRRLRREAEANEAPDGYQIKGRSTLYDADGEVKIEWVKTTQDAERQKELFREGLEAMKDEVPRRPPKKAPQSTLPDLLNLYTITDFHLGMLAWHKEGGDDWDVKIAERTLLGCFDAMMDGAPKAGTAVICQLGDFLHSDGIVPMTPTSHHILDQDGRFSKIVRSAIHLLRSVIDSALEKHDNVHVIMAEGNHDISSSIWLRQMFAALYEDEPRVTIDISELPYYAHQHGDTMLAFHHGHVKKFNGLIGMFAAQFAQMWGATKYRYGHSGHTHHTHVKEDMGMTMTQHQTLSARDAYASRGGWHSERKAECTTYHKKHGKVASNHVTPEMIDG
jgi:hypothetical protein